MIFLLRKDIIYPILPCEEQRNRTRGKGFAIDHPSRRDRARKGMRLQTVRPVPEEGFSPRSCRGIRVVQVTSPRSAAAGQRAREELEIVLQLTGEAGRITCGGQSHVGGQRQARHAPLAAAHSSARNGTLQTLQNRGGPAQRTPCI